MIENKVERPPGGGRSLCAAALIWLVAAGSATAHEFAITEAQVVFETDGSYRIDLTVDVDALALGVSPTTDSGQNFAELSALSASELSARAEAAADTILRRVRARFDGVKQRPDVVFPERGAAPREPAIIPSVLGITARLTGSVPPGAREFTFGASRSFNVVNLTIVDRNSETTTTTLLGVSEDSPAHPLDIPPPVPSRSEIARRYLSLGFEHILPRGLDHILFVLGLFLLSTKLAPLLWQVTAFTIAHTASLAMSMYGVVSLPSRWVEPLIAVSIAYIAVENILTPEMKPWRPAVVFGFGLLHGLGFAGVLRELGLPTGEFVTALVTFNIGVELGQLAVILLAFLLVGWFREREGYRRAVVIPASAAIALVGLYWSIERALGL